MRRLSLCFNINFTIQVNKSIVNLAVFDKKNEARTDMEPHGTEWDVIADKK